MLRRIGETKNTAEIRLPMLPIGEAAFPSPFKSTLEFNPPAHGVWNIVHTGMLIPESHQIFICSANCMRGVVLTAAEMNAADRFSQVLIEEKDVLSGSIEKLTVEGVTDCLKKLEKLPGAVLIYTVCMHHFMGADLDWIYWELGKRFPSVAFIRCFMDPIMRKSGPTPDQKMRLSLWQPIKALPAKPKTAALLGSDFATDGTGDLKVFLTENGCELKELPLMKTYEEYLSIGESSLFISCYPAAFNGARALAKRLNRPHVHLPLTFDFSMIEKNEARLAEALNAISSSRADTACHGTNALAIKQRDPGLLKERACRALSDLREKARDTEISIDYTFHPCPLGLSRLLLDSGFNVKRVYLDMISRQEEDDFYFLKKHYPQLLLCSTVAPEGRLAHGGDEGHLCLGQKAAWFTGSRHFVNIVEGAGWYGFDGVSKLAAAAIDAIDNEKDPGDYIQLKGIGCDSCVL